MYAIRRYYGIDVGFRHVERVCYAGFDRFVDANLEIVADEITRQREDEQHRQHPAYDSYNFV